MQSAGEFGGSSFGPVLVEIRDRLAAIERKLDEASMLPRALRQKDAAKMLSRSVRTVGQLVKEGKLRTVIIGGKKLIPFSEIVRITSIPSKAPRRPPDASIRRPASSPREEAEKARALNRRR